MTGAPRTRGKAIGAAILVAALALDLYFGTFVTAGFACGALCVTLYIRHLRRGAERGALSAAGIPFLDEELRRCVAPLSRLGDLERRFEKLSEEHRTLTENLAASIIIRSSEGDLLYCSPFTEVLTGYSLREITTASEDFFLTIVHPDDRERYQRALLVSSYGEPFQVRFRILHKSGIEMWAESRTVPVLDEHGAVIASLSITLDVTGAVRYQRQVEERNRDLQDFTYMVSHDLKAPIFTIKGMLAVINEDVSDPLPEAIHEPLEHVGKATKRLEQLVSSVLEYAKLTAQESVLEPVSLTEILREVSAEMEPQVRQKNGELVVGGELPLVRADRVKLYQVFTNLIVNALKYSAPSRPPKIEIRAVESRLPRTALVEVSDNGLGIPESRLEDIFRPFQRIHSTDVEGSGIGLASVKRLMEKLGGDITVRSTVDKGSTFTLSFRREEG